MPVRNPTRTVVAALATMVIYGSVGSDLALATTSGDIHNLGALGGNRSVGYGINGSGQVVGEATTAADFAFRAFRYDGTPGTDGVMRDLGTLGGKDSEALGINNAGQVSGRAYTATAFRAFRYDGTPGSGGVMRDLGTLGGAYSYGIAINASGQVAGYASTPTINYHAFRYDGTPGVDGVMRDLGTLGGTGSDARDINDSGQVVGAAQTVGNTTYHAYRYDGTPGIDGVMRDLGSFGGASFGFGINAAGQVTGQAYDGDGRAHAFRYDGTPGSGGIMRDLGTLGGAHSTGHAINDAGFVVGASDRSATAGGARVAALWRPDLSAVDLDGWLDAVNPSLGALWTLREANDINGVGLITGSGDYNDGPDGLSDGTRAFLLDASGLIPEPHTMSLFGTLLAMTLRRSRVKGPNRLRNVPVKRSTLIDGFQSFADATLTPASIKRRHAMT
jgi:probable HAF family extracellular repeat protein